MKKNKHKALNQSNHYFYNRIGKRSADIIGSITLIIILFPFIILFSIILVLFSGRPLFFRQIRSGLNDCPFTIWKFRTMKTELIEYSDHQYHWTKEVPKDFLFTKPEHLQVTRIGKIYRKFSVDEIPQLWNVLKGDMSFVGPRPEIVEITIHYSSEQKKRLLVKPGITGYAQVYGRSTITYGEKIERDLYYVQNCSFILDFKIIIRSIGIVITGKGAY
ncbi:hypothetical protein AM499_01000 [Bacillus sp. FJAT-22090]|uniref:sugar transferase n=1 Tax=Bacillus sp. FJAT-22090 TaxID=1581038 RepID=UPI0006BC4D2F|nr:sugar transferase [Bacillus sp. FJAT-22090]ALC84557.1 hypothetical protein AM499_01000 [Bacillus sp. FJAT-22090]